jgi:GTP cyclohydrolase FolE2
MPRRVWVLRRACAGCATAVERMAGAMTAHELERARAATSARVDARIEALAARRAARSTEAQT